MSYITESVNGLIVLETTQNIFCRIAVLLKIQFLISVSLALLEVIVTLAGIGETILLLF